MSDDDFAPLPCPDCGSAGSCHCYAKRLGEKLESAEANVKALRTRVAELEAELRKRPWIDGQDIAQGEHEADTGLVGYTLSYVQPLQAEVERLRDRVAELERDFARRQASHCCPAWDDQAGQCDCDERMGKLVARVAELERERDDARAERDRARGNEQAALIQATEARLRADRAEAQVATLREALSKHCRGIVSIPCSMCHDSTWDHECDSREEPCPHCAALAPYAEVES